MPHGAVRYFIYIDIRASPPPVRLRVIAGFIMNSLATEFLVCLRYISVMLCWLPIPASRAAQLPSSRPGFADMRLLLISLYLQSATPAALIAFTDTFAAYRERDLRLHEMM